MKTIKCVISAFSTRFILHTLVFVVIGYTSTALSARPTDVDADNDGLIDIATLDELNQIRYNSRGTGLTDEFGITNSSGCPDSGCFGYELVRNLDFDRNHNDSLEDNAFWNNGKGWEPIGTTSRPFSAIFEGNRKAIKNLHINRPDEDYVGLFGVVDAAEIRNLSLQGLQHSVTGRDYVGGIVGGVVNEDSVENTKILGIFNTGVVIGNTNVGGILGILESWKVIIHWK